MKTCQMMCHLPERVSLDELDDPFKISERKEDIQPYWVEKWNCIFSSTKVYVVYFL